VKYKPRKIYPVEEVQSLLSAMTVTACRCAECVLPESYRLRTPHDKSHHNRDVLHTVMFIKVGVDDHHLLHNEL
jgi:hypothetical protein